jgi:hypothetical protein
MAVRFQYTFIRNSRRVGSITGSGFSTGGGTVRNGTGGGILVGAKLDDSGTMGRAELSTGRDVRSGTGGGILVCGEKAGCVADEAPDDEAVVRSFKLSASLDKEACWLR